MEKIIFAFRSMSVRSERESLILANSIRTFGGVLSGSQIWVMVPEGQEELSEAAKQTFSDLNVTIKSFPVEEHVLKFPFAGKVAAAAQAEKLAEGEAAVLVWMDADSFVIQEPDPLVLETGKVLGCRPVDHVLIGPKWSEPLDPFWQRIYAACEIDESSAFPMRTSVDEVDIRPYINAGMLVVRPERKILRTWWDTFHKIYLKPEFDHFYQQNQLYKIFVHQAVLAGVVMKLVKREEIFELPWRVNYPFHMHDKYPAARKPAAMNDLVSCRFDTFFEDQSWMEKLAVEEPLRSWLLDQIRISVGQKHAAEA
jgi:hypothetical protein